MNLGSPNLDMTWSRKRATLMCAALLQIVYKCVRKLLELLHHGWELQLCFGQGLHYQAFGVFRGEVARRGHFADQQILSALKHFLFAEGEGLAATERDETLEDYGHLQKRTGAHAL